MRTSLKLVALLAVSIVVFVSPGRADSGSPQPAPPAQSWDAGSGSLDREALMNGIFVVEDSPWEPPTSSIHNRAKDIAGLSDHREGWRIGDMGGLPILHVMPKREVASGGAGDPIDAPEPPNLLLLACGVTSVLLVRSRITPR